jgi:hypothetical protein
VAYQRNNHLSVCGPLSRRWSFDAEFQNGGNMKLQKAIFGLMGLMLLFAAQSWATQVKTDYDRNANFGQYKTYSWEKVKTKDPLDVDRIKSAVNSALTAKGWTQVDSGGDVSVVAMEMTRNQQTLNTFYDGFGGGWRWRGFGGLGEATTTTETYKVGTLVVDLFDAKTKQLIWRGNSSDTLSNNSNKNIQNLDKDVEKMFKQFPPGSSKK